MGKIAKKMPKKYIYYINRCTFLRFQKSRFLRHIAPLTALYVLSHSLNRHSDRAPSVILNAPLSHSERSEESQRVRAKRKEILR